MRLLKASGHSRCHPLATAIAGYARAEQSVEIVAVGARAVHNMVEAVIVARSFLQKSGWSSSCSARFARVQIEEREVTAIVFAVACSAPHTGATAEAGEAPAELVRVAALSNVAAIVGATSGLLRDRGAVEVRAIGAQAVNQMVKAIIAAGEFLAEEGVATTLEPRRIDVRVEGVEKPAIRFRIAAGAPR